MSQPFPAHLPPRGALLVLALTALAPGCERPAADGTRHLVLTGSGRMAPWVKELGERFEASRPGVRVDVHPTGSDQAVAETRQGLADVGMVARPLRPDETGLHATLVGRDGLALVVHRTNPVAALAPDQVAALYTRGVTSWKAVGGSDRPVTLVGFREERSARDAFLDHFELRARRVVLDQAVGGSGAAVQAVAGLPNALAYAALGPAEAAAAAGQPVRLLPLGGAAATLDNVRAGSYPWARPLHLVTREAPEGLARDFLDFARSAEGQKLLGQHGFAPAGP